MGNKICKINHTRPAFNVPLETNKFSDKGVLYIDPVAAPVVDLDKHIADAMSKSMGLYKVFICQDKKGDDYYEIVSILNGLTSSLCSKMARKDGQSFKIYDKNSAVKGCRSFLLGFWNNPTNYVKINSKEVYSNDLSIKESENISIEEAVHNLCTTHTRRSLRVFKKDKKGNRISVIAVLEQVLIAFCKKEDISKINSDHLTILLETLYEDYTKTERRAQIKKSIENKVVKVEAVKDEDGNYVLRPSFADHKNKHYLFDFMKEYAEGDQVKRDQMQIRMRELILLFFCGPYVYIESHELLINSNEEEARKLRLITPWSFGSYRPEEKVIFDRVVYGKEKERFFSETLEDLFGAYHDTFENEVNDKKEKTDKKEATAKKAKRKVLFGKIQERIRGIIVNHYNAAKEVLEKENGFSDEKNDSRFFCADLFWIDYFSRITTELLIGDKIRKRNIEQQYLCEYAWKKWKNLIAEKYIDLGKAVYHFSVKDSMEKVMAGETTAMGYVQAEFSNGISSFEYERIKARDSLDRALSQAVTCAVDNISRSAIPDEYRKMQEDSLLWNKEGNRINGEIVKLQLKEEASRNLLRFFGGVSSFGNYGTEEARKLWEKENLFYAIKDEVYPLRNAYFHYSGVLSETQMDPAIKLLFDSEKLRLEDIYRQKYFSNNVYKFYGKKEEEIQRLMTSLYETEKPRPAQIPAFKNVLPAAEVVDFITSSVDITTEKGKQPRNFIQKKTLDCFFTDETVEKMYKNCIYFLLKELYYHDFLCRDSLKDEFLLVVDEVEEEYKKANAGNRKKDRKMNAMGDFKGRITQLCKKDDDISFGAICQDLLVEYMVQNNKPEVDTGKSKADFDEKEPIYQHYRELLYYCLNRTFFKFIVTGGFSYLRNPSYSDTDIAMEELWTGFKLEHRADCIFKLISEESGLRGWYVAAHFLMPKQLNHLIGDIKNYIQFTSNIEVRSALLNNRQNKQLDKEHAFYNKLLQVLSYVQVFCGKVSKTVTDYFTEEEYLDYLAHFVSYRSDEVSQSDKDALKAFSTKPISCDKEHFIGLFMDKENFILNRHVVRASMYGNVNVLEGCMKPVNEKEIQDYYKGMKGLPLKIKDGVYADKKTRLDEKALQLARNRITLLDVTVLTEMINDLLGELVSWSYLRERDMMYYQLGFWYTRIFHGNAVAEDSYLNAVKKDNTTNEGERNNGFNITKGAVLYQIASMYTYSARLIERNKTGYRFVSGSGMETGVAIPRFVYSYCQGDESVYFSGLEFFENVAEHDDIVIDVRNYIDHFKYLVGTDRSILDLFSEIYDRFFSYDRKLAKNSVTALKNILARYFVVMDLRIQNTTKQVKISSEAESKQRKAAMITIGSGEAEAVKMTYNTKLVDNRKDKNNKGNSFKTKKGKDEKKYYMDKVYPDARSKEFLDSVVKLLEYRAE